MKRKIKNDTGVMIPRAFSWDGPFIRPLGCGFARIVSKTNVLEDHRLAVLEASVSWRIILRGMGVCHFGADLLRLTPGTVLCYREPINMKVRGVPHQLPWEYFWINFSGAQAQAILDFVTHKFGQTHQLPLNCATVKTAERFVAATQQKTERSAFEWSRMSYAFLMTWFSDANRHVTPIRIHASKPPMNQPLNMLPHRVKQFAAAVGYSRAHLSRKLADHWHRPPGQLLRELRLDQAAKRLRNTNQQITEIARETGYSCSQAFGRAFATKFKVTPTQYRHRARGLL